MSDSPRYLVAKYVSDLQRMEPRNIGVVVWAGGGVSARFLAEKPESPGDIDGRSIPPFVASMGAYKQWVDFWRDELKRGFTKGAGGDQIEYLKHSSKGNFCLVDGGVILDDVGIKQLPELTDELFYRLVDSRAWEDPRDVVLDRIADDVIKKLQLARNSSFHTRYEVACRIAPNVNERFEFSHAFKNGSLKRLYQRVPLARRPTPLRRTIHDSAWMFEKVVQQGIIERDQAIALVYATEENKRDPEVSWSFDVLGSVARIANLADPTEAVSAFIIE